VNREKTDCLDVLEKKRKQFCACWKVSYYRKLGEKDGDMSRENIFQGKWVRGGDT
jgi:hypothetical protein